MPTLNLKQNIAFLLLTILLASLSGFLAGGIAGIFFYQEVKEELSKVGLDLPERIPERIIERETRVEKEYLPHTSQEEAIIKVVREVSPSVVSIIITKDLPIIEEYWISPFEEFFGEPFGFKIPQYRQKGTEKREIGGGTGFIISEEGMVLTNKHVVSDKTADYTILTNDGKKYKAQVLARHPFQDLAILKIETEEKIKFKPLKLGDSSKIQIGQTVIAIGNALGEFRNTISVGVVSGLKRKITAAGGGIIETIEDLIQTDAAINKGNSGGPLLNLAGEVIGVNTAMAYGAENIGFAIPINKAKRAIEQVKKLGKISYPFLGVCWTQITPELKERFNLPVDYGAFINKDKNCPYGIFPNSAAEKAGLKVGDIILEWNGQKLSPENSLGKVIQKHLPGDKVILRVLRNGQEKTIEVILGERSG
jgi:S1-C subfamily serine protease